MHYMSISKLWYQQDSNSKRVTFVAKLPNKWLFYFPHHLFLEEGSQVPKDFAKSQTATMEAILLKESFSRIASMVAVWDFAKSFANLLRSGSALEHVNRVEKIHYTF